MSVMASLAKAAGAKVLTGTRPASKPLPRTKRTLIVALTLVALVSFAALIAASQAPNAEHDSSLGSKDSQPGALPVSESAAAPQMSKKEAIDAYGKLPLSFVANEGQTDEAVRYYAQGAGYGFFFTKEGATLSFADGKGGANERSGYALALDFLGVNPYATLTAQKRLSGEVNYLVGDDPAKWQQGLPTHGELHYGGLWPGIDMAVRGEAGKLKSEFHLKPGSSVEDVRLAYRGAEGLKVGAGGELLIQTPLGILEDAAPVSYQRIGGERVPVESRYKLLKAEGGYGFAVGSYDPRYPLVIDPELDYSTFLGGTGSDAGLDIAVRESNAYVTGFTTSTDYPTTSAYDTSFNGGFTDAFVTKLNASGSALVYSTFLGGSHQDDGKGIAVDGSGSAYVTGLAQSADYPTTAGAFDTSFNGATDAFVTKLNSAGSELDYSTFLGGTNFDDGSDIAVREGRAFVTGQTQSADYPTTAGAFDTSFNGGSTDVFVTKLNASGSALDYSTFLGGTGGMRKRDEGRGIAVDGGGSAYVTGLTQLADYPTPPGAFDTTFFGGPTGSNFDAFVTKLNASGSELVYSTFLGGTTEDIGNGIAVREGRAYVTGYTRSADYPTTAGAFDTTRTRSDVFVTKLNASGSALAYSTFLGGTSLDEGDAIAVDGEGRAYVTGSTTSANYPTTSGAFDRTFNGGYQDAFVTKLNASGSALAYSTFLGGTSSEGGSGIAVDGEDRAYVTGPTQSADYPTTPSAFDTTFHGTFNGAEDTFVTKLPTG
jgi:hypothetical protein